jgi:ribosomal protein S18 acetylase RimI-like enzyme
MISCEILPLAQIHIIQSVEIHLRSFPDFFLSFLGPTFLREFYSSFLYDAKGIGFVAQASNGRILGVAVGPLDPNGYFKRLLLRRWWAFCFASIGAIVRKPSSFTRLFRAIFYRGENPFGNPRALLSSVAVAPEAQAMGIGKALVESWTAEVQRRGATGCYLTTDACNNTAVNDFYKSIGWRIATTFVTPEGRQMHCYVYDFL